MRRNLTVCRAGLSVAAAVVLLTACGGSDNGGSSASASASSGTSSSASQTSAGAADSEFCTQAAGPLSAVQPALSGQGDPPSLAPALQQAADKIRAIKPPSEIAADWTAVADGIEQIAQAFAGANVTDPASASALQQRTTGIIGQLSAPATNVQNYLAEKCGLGIPSTGSASPTS
jgi:hypothetical protein